MSCYPSGALLASQMCVGRSQEGWILANPDNPSDSSEVSFLVQRQRDGLRVLAGEMAIERCLRLFIYAGVRVWATKDENPLGIYSFHIFLGSGILQVHPFVGVTVCLLFQFFTCSHRFQHLLYFQNLNLVLAPKPALSSFKACSLISSWEVVISSEWPCPDSSLGLDTLSRLTFSLKGKVSEILNNGTEPLQGHTEEKENTHSLSLEFSTALE